jgi:hypothetical protein
MLYAFPVRFFYNFTVTDLFLIDNNSLLEIFQSFFCYDYDCLHIRFFLQVTYWNLSLMTVDVTDDGDVYDNSYFMKLVIIVYKV